MKHHVRTPPLWRAWVETVLADPATLRVLDGRALPVEVLRQVASAESGLARHGVVRAQTATIAELLELPEELVMKARLALVHLGVLLYLRADDGALWRELIIPPWLGKSRALPDNVQRALDRITAADDQHAYV